MSVRRRWRWLWPAGVLLLAGVLALPPGGATSAAWHAEVSVGLPDATSDQLHLGAVDIDQPWGPVRNIPRVDLTNSSERQTGFPQVAGTSVAPGPLPGSDALAGQVSVTHGLAQAGGDCAGPVDPVPGAGLAPGQTRPMCLDVSTPLTDQQLLLNHAGRSVAITSEVHQDTAPPATWSSPSEDVNSTFRVTFPRPTPRNNGLSPLSNSCVRIPRGLLLLPDAELRWAWPTSEGFTQVATPAVDRWGLYRRVYSTDPWSLYNTYPGNTRSVVIPSGQLGEFLPILNYGYEWKIVAFPTSGTDVRAESTHVIRTRQALTNLADPCLGAVSNSTGTPVVGFP